MLNSTSQAAPGCEPEKRDLRPSRWGLGEPDDANLMMPASTATMNRSSRKPSQAPVPISGMAKCLLNSAP